MRFWIKLASAWGITLLGSTVAVGSFELHHGKGEFLQNIKVDISRLRGAKLVTANGAVVALATFA